MEKTSWTERVKNEELQSLKEERNSLYTIKQRKTNCIGHMLRRNCLLKHVNEIEIEERTELTARRRRRRKQLLDFKKTKAYWALKW